MIKGAIEMDSKCVIIAEAGVNHNGSLETACRLIQAAADARADYVKFQTFLAAQNVTPDAVKATYQQQVTDIGESQYEMLKKLELGFGEHRELVACCERNGIQFLSTPFDHESIALLQELGQTVWKIPSGEITNLPYLRKIGSFQQPIILSTGMARLGEIEAALSVLAQAGTPWEMITVLHCNTEYPTPIEDVNLRAMQTIEKAFPGVKVGYSDHTMGTEVAIAAVAMGASVIEKHFTLDRLMPGPDHQASLEPDELAAMVRAVRNVERAQGNGIKRPSPSEQKNIAVARKSIVAARDIAEGELFAEENLTVKRPGTGISPMRWDELIGGPADRPYRKDELIDA